MRSTNTENRCWEISWWMKMKATEILRRRNNRRKLLRSTSESQILTHCLIITYTSSRAQARVPQTLVKALQQIQDQTGYIGLIALAGPDGQREGEIKTLSYVF